MDIEKLGPYSFRIKPEGKMRVPVKVFADEKVLEKMKQDDSLKQACNVASLPGIVGESIVMPDAHQGYGFSIGGVAAFDMKEGIISPGGIGFDINCGIRLVSTSLTRDDVEPKKQELLDLLFKACPVGVGVEGIKIPDEELEKVMLHGAEWAVENGYGTEDDLQHCESSGCIPEANPRFVPERAVARGRKQLGTVGAGNHFVEIQVVDKIFIPEVAEKFGLKENQILVMIHTGSRGFGHQICSEYIRMMEKQQPDVAKSLDDMNLIYAPIESELAKKYWGAMNSAANFAFTNRHIIADRIRKVFSELFPGCSVSTVYDVCHNIAKRENHLIDGKLREVLVHRKGATRAFPPGSIDVPEAYRAVGQPVLIPGSMGTASYVLVGAEGAMEEAFGSTAHGAGRLMSRTKAKKQFPSEEVEQQLKKLGVAILSATRKGVSEEAPGAYKDVDEVVRISDNAGIAKIVARLVPIGVIKG